MLKNIWVAGLALASLVVLADNNVSTQEKILDLESQLAIVKADAETAKALASQERASAFNPSISVVGDVMGQVGFNMGHHDHDHSKDDKAHDHEHGHEFHNGVMVRSVEFEFRGSVDPFADALVVVGLEPHGFHHVDVHLEEAFARLKKWPFLGFAPFGAEVKFGKFKTAFGRMNRIHLHNIPQITYPLAVKAFLGEEGYAAPGVSLNVGRNIGSSTALNLFLEGVFLSRLPLQEKGAEKMPTGIAHLWWHQALNESHNLDVGFSNLLGRKGKKGSGTFYMVGGDIHYSYVPGGAAQNPLFLLGNELFSANASESGKRWPIGNFTWAQVHLGHASFLGVRYDLAPKEEELLSMNHALSAYLSHYTTEFLRLRLGYEHVMPELNSFKGDHRVMLNMIFILGSHPAEPYFINR